jgi:hypothetical protein
VSSPPFPLNIVASPLTDAITSCHTSFPLSRDKLATSASCSGNASPVAPHSWAKTETLNTHHRRRSSSPDRPTPILHCYKKVILTLTILPTSLLHLHFDSFWARAAHHQSSTCRCRSLSPLFHAHRPSVQWHPRWWTSRPSFASWTAYRYVNSRKKIFWNPTASCGVIN